MTVSPLADPTRQPAVRTEGVRFRPGWPSVEHIQII